MAVHRRGSGRRRTPSRRETGVTRVLTQGQLGSAGGGDLGAAAEIIARRAREIASSWSEEIPASISVSGGGRVVTITADAPNARPAELQLRHPLFGDREHWYGPPGPPFLVPAADSASDKAMQRYARKIDTMAAKAGFR